MMRLLYRGKEKEQPHWDPSEIDDNTEAEKMTAEKMKSRPPPQPPQPRLSFPPPEAAEIQIRKLVPADELESMLRKVSFQSPFALAQAFMDRFGVRLVPRTATLLLERSEAYKAGTENDEMVVKELKLDGTLYLSVHHFDNASQSIYAIDLSQIEAKPVDPSLIDAQFRPTMVSQSKTEAFPCIELSAGGDGSNSFSSSKMFGVRLDMRLYLMGGVTLDSRGDILIDGGEDRRVFYIEFDNIKSNSPIDMIKEVAPMICIKAEMYPFVAEDPFVAKDQIYVISSATPALRCGRFEVYDPVNNVWTLLPEPPFECPVNSHLVFNDNKKVILGTFDAGYHCFNLETKEWNREYTRFLHRILNPVTPLKQPVKVGNLIYWDSEGNDIAVFGPDPSDVAEADYIKLMFKEPRLRSKQLMWDLRTFEPDFKGATALHYLGAGTFIYVISGLTKDPFPDQGQDTLEGEEEACDMRLIIFKIPAEEHQQQRCRKFSPQVVHVAQLVCKSREGMGCMADSFIIF